MVRILEKAYKDTFSAVRVNGDITDWFNTIVGVLQGCVLSPLLFNIFLEIIIAMALDGTDAGVVIGGELLTNLRFADDISVLADNVDNYKKQSAGFMKPAGRWECASMCLRPKYSMLAKKNTSSRSK